MEWGLRGGAGPPQEWFKEVGAATGLSRPTLQVCYARGLQSSDAIQAAMSSKLSDLPSPLSILGMSDAVSLLCRHRSGRVRVFGDYDVDGTCGAALLFSGLRKLGFQVDAVQPDRFKDGYGVNVGAVEKAHEDGVALFVTVDCGITSFDALARARELGLAVVVVDHHRVSDEKGLPVASAIIDPHQSADSSGLQELCGTGLAFFLLIALRAEGRSQGWFAEGAEPNLRQELDLVAVATACDQVPLQSVNRVLVRHGMKVLREGRRVGLRALLEIARVQRGDLSFSSLSFTLGPRINASGRMASATHAFRLLTTENEREAFQLAYELEQLNRERGLLQEAIVEAALVQARVVARPSSCVLCDSSWHEGVLGIVATRIVEKLGVTAVVLTEHEGLAKGSLRAASGKDVLSALHECRESLAGFGGHKAAAGARLPIENLEKFRAAFDRAIGDQVVAERAKQVDAELNLGELGLSVIEELEQFGPFGVGNPEPVVGLKVRAESLGRIKNQHLKLALRASDESEPVEGIWFRAPNEITWDAAQSVECAVVPEVNRFRGRKRPVLRIKYFRSNAAS